MIRKFLEGLVFGGGFGISFIAIWYIAAYIVTTLMISSEVNISSDELAEITETTTANVIREQPESRKHRDYSFFKSTSIPMDIPNNGGILSMAKLPTQPEAKRPSTVQLWLTKNEFWLIKTTDSAPEIKRLAYPAGNPKEEANEIIFKYSGYNSGMSSTTVSEQTISMLQQGFASARGSMNGKLQITEENVVFLQPNEY
jgi:hypothetical protein